jgi:hypothetical protein
MNSALNTVIFLFRWWFGTAQFDRIAEMVRNLIFSDMANADKGKLVKETFWDEVARLKAGWSTGALIDIVIGLIRAKYEQKK